MRMFAGESFVAVAVIPFEWAFMRLRKGGVRV